MRPIIVLTVSRSAAGSGLEPLASAAMKYEYFRCVHAAGGAPVMLPNTACRESVAAALSAAHGLLLTGGGDVDPARYGRQRHASVDNVDPLRDETEILAVAEALRLGLPVFGICRGIQVLNVALGGTLIQDIPTHFAPRAATHRDVDHGVRVEPASRLGALWPAEMTVNSKHHQAVETLADGLRPTAWSPDGIIEAAESADGKDVLAVQCHPETLAAERAEFLKPFAWLIDRARRFAGQA